MFKDSSVEHQLKFIVSNTEIVKIAAKTYSGILK